MDVLPESLRWAVGLPIGTLLVVVIALTVQLLIRNWPGMLDAIERSRGSAHMREVERDRLVRQDLIDAAARKREVEKAYDEVLAELRLAEQQNRELERKLGNTEGQLQRVEAAHRERMLERDYLLKENTRHEHMFQLWSEFLDSPQASEQTRKNWPVWRDSVKDRRQDVRGGDNDART